MIYRIVTVCALLLSPLPAVAQDQTLADIRQQLSGLFVEVQRLRRELSTTGGLNTGISGNTPLDRLNAIEAELQRLTSNAEQLEFRISRITSEADNRIGDLNFRLCELEPACDISQLDDTPLGGIQTPVAPDVATDQSPDEPALAVGEQADFARAQDAIAAGDMRTAADQLADFTTTYPGSPLSTDANFLRGEALEALGQTTDAARAYLAAFSGDPSGSRAPSALYKLGASLGLIGQTQDACLTLAEVNVRFPGDPAVALAQGEMQALGCQ
ncbi:MAG: tol-pal system protein YbgF [Yoonia sp.]|uniref:tol-pal system protein YbgF n=1 Tax=Yoonia sp. TaxID=2212373 RepID=UPI003EF88855